MADDDARQAAAKAAFEHVEPGMTLGLGSGRAVFSLAEMLGSADIGSSLLVVCASTETEERAKRAGLEVIPLDEAGEVDLLLDGADEVDADLSCIKGGGAALLHEKMLSHASDRTIIFCQESKLVERLGSTRLLPVEVVKYGWTWTHRRIVQLGSTADLRRNEDGSPVITDESDYLLDVSVPTGDLVAFADALTNTLGVVEHGLFLSEADAVILGSEDGSSRTLLRSY